MTTTTATLLALCGSFLTATAQVLLKHGSTVSRGQHRLRLWVNPFMAAGYGLFLVVVYLNTIALRVLPYHWVVVFVSLAYVLVAVLARVILGERMNRTQLAGLALILAGIAVFHSG
jgi:drug/metabolite transporter (DMT)-like permease